VKVAICGDNKKEIQEIRKLTNAAAVKLNVYVENLTFSSCEELFFYYESLGDSLRLVLMNAETSSGMNGIQAAKKLRDHYHYSGEIVFIAKSKKYVLDAFDVHAYYYIVRNEMTERRLRSISEDIIYFASLSEKNHLLCKGQGEYRHLPMDCISYFEVKHHVVTVYYGRGKHFDFSASLGALEEELSEEGFLRVHRSFLVNSEKIEHVTRLEITLRDKAVIPVGRHYLPELKEHLGKFQLGGQNNELEESYTENNNTAVVGGNDYSYI